MSNNPSSLMSYHCSLPQSYVPATLNHLQQGPDKQQTYVSLKCFSFILCLVKSYSYFKTHHNCNLLWKLVFYYLSHPRRTEGYHCTFDNISASKIQYFTELLICMPIHSTELFLALFYQKILAPDLAESRYSINVHCMTKCG